MDRLEKSAVADLLHHIAGMPLPSGHVVGLDRAVRAARALAIRARKGRVEGLDYMPPTADRVEAALRGVARPALADCERRVPTWTVAPADPDGGGRWEIRADGMLADTVASHYDVAEVLAVAERYAAEHHAGRPLAWVLDPILAGFRSVTAGEVAGL